MNNIKIVFFDIDGTLIDMRAKRISEKTLETLVRLKEVASDVCGHVAEDGIYHYCMKHGLISANNGSPE